MFTGIVSGIGKIVAVARRPGDDLHIAVAAEGIRPGAPAIGASIACSGVCLTVVGVEEGRFRVDVSSETVARTAGSMWREGACLNLERALRVGDELGGHIVTGHVDGVGRILSREPVEGSWRLGIAAPAALGAGIAPKGSIAVDGVSLTVNDVADIAGETRFFVNIIPHTAAATTLGSAAEGQQVNLEIDLLARYLARLLAARGHSLM
jgi:riboflavin synthase